MGKRQLPDGVVWPGTKDGDPTISGPFDTESEINNAFIKKTLLIDQTWNKRGPKRAEFYRRMLPGVLRNHEPVFTHGDLQRKNTIIQPALAEERDRPLSEVMAFHVTLVDWENAGWYPSYWEYCSASWSFRFDDDWPEYLEKAVDPWPVEYLGFASSDSRLIPTCKVLFDLNAALLLVTLMRR